MRSSPNRIVVFQTAFMGDVILTLPMVQTLRKLLPKILIDFVATPSSAQVLMNHPDIHRIIIYDKKGTDRGLLPALKLASNLRASKYDAALIPHRSFRSAAVCCHAGIPRRIGFSTSAAPWLLTDQVPYDKNSHETVRNSHLLLPLGYDETTREVPKLYTSTEDVRVVDEIVGKGNAAPLIALAPGSVWATKRWHEESFIALSKRLVAERYAVALIGGKEDEALAARIKAASANECVLNAAGRLTILQSAELIRRAKVLVSNDSAPMHIGTAMRTPVVAIFGATVPEFGFAPLGERDVVVETRGLKCRPCGIHGGSSCPIKTFDCMRNIRVDDVLERVKAILNTVSVEAA